MGDDRAIFAGEPILRGETIFRRFKTFPNCYRGQKGRIFNGPTMLLREKKKKKKKWEQTSNYHYDRKYLLNSFAMKNLPGHYIYGKNFVIWDIVIFFFFFFLLSYSWEMNEDFEDEYLIRDI